MRHYMYTAFILFSFLLGGLFLFPCSAESTDTPDQDALGRISAPKDSKGRVVDYLESATLDPNYGGEVFADYYEFGMDENKLYIWAYICEYYPKNGQLMKGSAKSSPMIIHLSPDGAITGHWEPKPGSKYTKSIRDKFQKEYEDDVLNFQNQHKEKLVEIRKSTRQRAQKEKKKQESTIKELKPGETACIKLDANRTTGYKWFYNIQDSDIIDVVSDKYKEKEHKQEAVGVGGKRILKIRALQKGSTSIKFKYYREWNPDEVAESKELTINVTERGQADFDFPENIDADYISIQDWEGEVLGSDDEYPENIGLRDGKVYCTQDSEQSSGQTKMLENKINGRRYCIQKSQEGAAILFSLRKKRSRRPLSKIASSGHSS